MAEDTAQTKQKVTEIDKGSTVPSGNSKIDDTNQRYIVHMYFGHYFIMY